MIYYLYGIWDYVYGKTCKRDFLGYLVGGKHMGWLDAGSSCLLCHIWRKIYIGERHFYYFFLSCKSKEGMFGRKRAWRNEMMRSTTESNDALFSISIILTQVPHVPFFNRKSPISRLVWLMLQSPTSSPVTHPPSATKPSLLLPTLAPCRLIQSISIGSLNHWPSYLLLIRSIQFTLRALQTLIGLAPLPSCIKFRMKRKSAFKRLLGK